MILYTYVIPRDYGFAPNPYFGYCTLGTCKPTIRKTAKIGDWVAAFGGKHTVASGKLVFLMQIQEVITFDQYWEDERFLIKRPVFNKGNIHMYGDNIYHHVDGEWVQEHSHHSFEDGEINQLNLNRDTSVDRVLISQVYYYFGENGISLPEPFAYLQYRNIGQKNHNDPKKIEEFINYMECNYSIGRHGIPCSIAENGFTHYSGK